MTFKPMILVAGVGLLLSAATQAALAPDARAHRACMERFKFTNGNEKLHLNPGPVYLAPGIGAGRYRYFFNATERGVTEPRDFRVACEARKFGRVTTFELAPGRWRYRSADAVDDSQ